MEGPAVKRPKLQRRAITSNDWLRWSGNLETLQQHVTSGCLCNMPLLELQRPIFPANHSTKTTEPNSSSLLEEASSIPVDPAFLKDYSVHFIATINMLVDSALKQQFNGFICKKLMDMASDIAMDEGTWEMLIDYLNSSDKFITSATSKCLVSLLIWTRLPNLNEIIDELFKSAMITTENPLKLTHILDIIRGVVGYKYASDCVLMDDEGHEGDFGSEGEEEPLGTDEASEMEITEDDYPLNNSTRVMNTSPSASENRGSRSLEEDDNPPLPPPPLPFICPKIEVDTEIVENEVKTLCVKALERWWTRLLSKFQAMMANYNPINEAPIVTYLTMWHSIIAGDNSLSVVDTKHYYTQLEAFVPLLNPDTPPLIWAKLTDIFNEVLCYGRTLALQDVPNEDSCDLAHLIIRNVRSRQFLQGIPYGRQCFSFGGSSVGPVDWKCKSQIGNRDIIAPPVDLDGHAKQENPSSSTSSNPSSSSATPVSAASIFNEEKSSLNCAASESSTNHEANTSANKSVPTLPPPRVVYIGPSREAIQLDDSFEDRDRSSGDRPLLQKVVLLVLKSVAVTVQETRVDDFDSDEDDHSMNGSAHSGSESEVNDMAFVENSIRCVFRELDLYVKSLLPFHPNSPLGEWIIKLFIDQDDALIESVICTLDTYRGFAGKIDIPQDFKEIFHPFRTFVTLITAVSNDHTVLLDWLREPDTPHFLTYFLHLMKFTFKNWSEFAVVCGKELDPVMSVLIRLRLSIGRLVQRGLWPYNINPVLRLLERCEELFESNASVGNSNNGNTAESSSASTSNSDPVVSS